MCKALGTIFSLVLLLSALSAHAAAPINTLEKKGFFGFKPNGVAIRGYDTVSYFVEGKAVEGNDRFTEEWMGAVWKFSSQQHLDLFTENPDRYAPQYGGYCAYGVAMNNLVKIEPELWTIVDNKLYLNYDNSVQQDWEKDIPGFIEAADNMFHGLLETAE